MDETLRRIGLIGLIPVVIIDDEESAIPAAQALLNGGIETMEITLRTEKGIAAIKKVSLECPKMMVGAGTVLSVDHAKKAVEAGAKYIVSPGFDQKLVKWCVNNNITIIPGCVTPTEIKYAIDFGLTVVKFFPADIYGGIQGCKALHGPFGSVSFVPTGGINDKNLSDYADKSYIHAVGGGWLCQPAHVIARNQEAITDIAAKAVKVMLGFELAHIGINENSDADAKTVADKFCNGFDLDLREGNTSYFTGDIIEVNKSKGRGAMGHIAIKTNNVDRAAYYLQNKGFTPDWSTRKSTSDRTTLVYLMNEFGGFAVHLLQK